ncbi:unnamed protein product [Lactuca virosa]|uniref:Transposase MuDR plant domain-containing protein n=1 Tax=Lactuca virosa TaxID=75947 RepID=A0AAU9MZ99_9ASTR|nr:unnamed protein product [Lactuca virosa]
MAVESEEVHHDSSEEYDSEEYEDDEEVLDTEHIDVEMEEDDFKTQGKERCKDAFLNFSYDYEDNEANEDNDLVDEDEEGFGSEEEINDTSGANDLDLGDTVGAGFPIHDPSVKWNKMKPLLGERYESPHQLQQCLTNYAIKSRYNIKFAKCDTVRLTAKCGSKMKSQPCPFRVHASWMTQEKSFQIKTLVDEHKCVRNFNISNLLSPRWLARHFLKELIMKPNLKCKEMQSIIRTKFHCGVSWSKAYRTRCRAMAIIDEKWESVVCPAAIKKMNKFGEDLRNWNVNPSGPSIFEARNGLEGGSRGGARGIRGGTGGKRGGAVGNTGGARGGAVGNRGGKRGGRGSKRGGRGSKTSVGIEGGGVAEVEGGGVENEDDTIPEKYLVHLWKAMQDLKLSGYSIEEIKNTLSLTDSHMKQLNDYNDTIEQVLPMSMRSIHLSLRQKMGLKKLSLRHNQKVKKEEEEEEEEEGINDTQELPVHLRIVKRRRPSERIVKTKLKKMGCVGTSANSALELD